MADPAFGETVENTKASTANPTRRGMFVRTIHRTGRLNPGVWWELTDGRGEFWQVRPENCVTFPGDGWASRAARAEAALRAAGPTLRAVGDRTVQRLCYEAMPDLFPSRKEERTIALDGVLHTTKIAIPRDVALAHWQPPHNREGRADG